MDTPYELRGWFYNTHLTQRCCAFRKCPMCTQCRNYDRHNAICATCEGRKPHKEDERFRCTCSPGKVEVFMKIQETMRKPFFDGGNMHVPDLAINLEEDLAYKALGNTIDQEFKDVGVKSVELTHEDEGVIHLPQGVI